METAERLMAFKDYLGMTNSQFADEAGIPRPSLSQLFSGRNKKISEDVLRKLHNIFPQLNISWLLFGDGDMVIDANIEISERQNEPDTGLFAYNKTDNQAYSPTPEQINAENNPAQTTPTSDNESAKQESGVGMDTKDASNAALSQTAGITLQPDYSKKVQTIMVFYSDNSFEVFKPAQ